MRCVAELQKQQRQKKKKRGNPVILLKIRKDLVLIGAGCVCATPSSLVPVRISEQHGRALQSPHLFCCLSLHMAPICCLIKECAPLQLL